MKERNHSIKRKHQPHGGSSSKHRAALRHGKEGRSKGFTMEDRILVVMKRSGEKGLTVNQMAAVARVSKREREAFDTAVQRMLNKGILEKYKGALHLAAADRRTKHRELPAIKATVITLTEKFGFARPEGEEPEQEDIFLPGRLMQGAMPGDTVLIRPELQRRGDRTEGKVIEILEENNEAFTGVVKQEDGIWLLMPDRNIRFPLLIDPAQRGGAKEGDKVLAHICCRGRSHFAHKVAIEQVFGEAALAENCCKAVLSAYHAHTAFDSTVIAEAKKIEAKGIPLHELDGRMDLTDLDIFTIDGADSKDLDDAISLEKSGDHWELGVHIADVSHYVKPNSAIDKEAYARGTSVYYADQVLPMLPKELSNGICSLNPDEVRLTFSALVTLNFQGEIIGFRFAKSYIRSRVKGIYDEVNAILDGTASPEIEEKYHQLVPQIFLMKELADVLMKNRFARGSMDIDSMESKFVISDGKIQDILPRQRGESERIIEEFMLTANQAAATLAMSEMLPFVYRVHSEPPAGKIELLHQTLMKLGLDASAIQDGLTAKDMSNVLEGSRGTQLEQMVNNQLLRTMAKAVYSEENIGHFGLVLKNYAHFTSPIRRYPDLIIHRILSSFVGGGNTAAITKRFGGYVAGAAKHCSDMELNAVAIERECEDCYKAEYMSRRIGQDFEGVITSVVAFGFYVQLPNTVEGLVHVRTLPQGDYALDGTVELVEERTNTRYAVGQKVCVTVLGADVSAGEVDFSLKEVLA